MGIKKIFVYCVILIIISCKKNLVNKVQFQNPSLQYDISVEGGVNSLDSNQFVKVFKPAFNISDNVEPVNNAQVFINDVELKITNSAGIYSTKLLDNKRYNLAYKLKIVFKGKTYLAEDTLYKVNAIDTLELDVIELEINSQDNLSIPKHVFNATKAAKIFYQLPGQQAWSPANFDATKYYSFLHTAAPPYGLSPVLEKRSNYLYNKTDSISVYKFSVSSAYKNFLYQTFQETDWKSLFSSTPGHVKGNISGNALGFFNCSDGIKKKVIAKSLLK